MENKCKNCKNKFFINLKIKKGTLTYSLSLSALKKGLEVKIQP